MYVRPSAPLSIGGVIDDAIKLYLGSFSRCWLIALMSAAIQAVMSLTVSARFPVSLANARQAFDQLVAFERSGQFIVGYLAAGLLALIFHGALLARQNAVASSDSSFTLVSALATGLRKLPAMLIVIIVFVLALGITAAVVLMPLRGLLGRGLGVLLLIVAALYLLGRLVLWMPALFVDNAGALQSIEITWNLTQGRWWRSAAILTVAVIIILVFAVVLGAVAGVLSGAFSGLGRGDLRHGLTTLQLISVATNIITLPMTPALWLAMYNDFKLRREGGDLAARVGALPGT